MSDVNQLLTLAGLVRRTRIPATWLRTECAAGRLPHLRAGSQLLFDLVAVERVLAERAARVPDAAAGPSSTASTPHAEHQS